MRLVPFVLLLLVAGAQQARSAPQKATDLKPLSDDAVSVMKAVEPDPPPKQLSANAHFLISDEKRHDLFADVTKDVGGMLIGVGTDQVYLMAGWARSEILVPMDFDQAVVDIHKVYRLLFLKGGTPAEFIARWAKSNEDTLKEMIDSEFTDAKEREGVHKALRLGRGLVHGKLKLTAELHNKLKVKSFVNDQDEFDYIVALFKTNRVFPVRGDLTASKTMIQLGDAARKINVAVRVLYLSNAEKYFPYTEQYKKNVLGLPFDDQTQVLRTQGWGEGRGAEEDGFYIYLVQTGTNYRNWLENARLADVKPVVAGKRRTKIPGFYIIDKEPKKKK
ncbi:MAG: hypothetical protein HUU55_21900 [Myxococcales bacterium]|nr:hypothetical protein [Myxococcales bacterium]